MDNTIQFRNTHVSQPQNPQPKQPSAAQQAMKHANWVSQVNSLKSQIQATQNYLTRYEKQSGFDKNMINKLLSSNNDLSNLFIVNKLINPRAIFPWAKK